MPLPILPQVNPSQGPEVPEGLTRKQLSYLGCVYFVAGDSDVDLLLKFLQRHVSIQTYINASAISSNNDILSLLDAGARKIFVQEPRLEELRGYGDRIVPVVNVDDETITAEKVPGGVLVTGASDAASSKAILERCKKSGTSPVYLALSSDLEKSVALATEYGAIPIVPSTNLMAEEGSSGSKISVSSLIGSAWTSDRADGLVPTVVTDERGISLGLVYSSQKSLAEALRTGTGMLLLLCAVIGPQMCTYFMSHRSLPESKTWFMVQRCNIWRYTRACESIFRLRPRCP